MTKRALLASAVAVSLSAAPALAGDWTGIYIGGHVGGAFGDTDWTNLSDGSGLIMDLTTASQEPDGVLGGGQIGYNFQMSNWLFGLEASIAGLDYDDTIVNPNGNTDEFLSSEVEWVAIGAARLGWTWQDSLLYLKGGYATGKVNTEHNDASGSFDGSIDRYQTDETHSGWTAGAGFEHQIGEHVSFGVEYNYIDLGNQDHTGITVTGLDTVVNDMDVQMHMVTARLNWNLFTP